MTVDRTQSGTSRVSLMGRKSGPDLHAGVTCRDRLERILTMIELPAYCAARHPETNKPIIIRRGEPGYLPWPKGNPITPEDFNKIHDVDEAVVQTMIGCCMSGEWEKADAVPMRPSLQRERQGKERADRGSRGRFARNRR